MKQYILKRLFLMIPTLLGITIITFTIVRLAPGDPTAESTIGEGGSVGLDPSKSGKDVRKAKRVLLGMSASYSYSTVTTDPDNDEIKYIFDWGDGGTTETKFVASGSKVVESHAWDPAGTYSVRVMAADKSGNASGWSTPLTVTITGREGRTNIQSQPDKAKSATQNNKPPLTPSTPEGSTSGTVDVPLYKQYCNWLIRIVSLDFGMYIKSGRPVKDEILERMPRTLLLSFIAIFLSYIIAVPIGVFSSTGRFPLIDKIITVILFILYSLPTFWIATVLMVYFSTPGRIIELPIRGLWSEGMEGLPFLPRLWDYIQHLILPVACLTYGGLAALSRYSRSGMMEVVRQDFIRTARAKGLSENVVIFKHALRNGLIPIITLMASILPAMIGGSVIIESIFTIEGMGKMAFNAILNREYNAIMAVSVMSAVLTLFGILLSDILYVIVDPRITFEKISR